MKNFSKGDIVVVALTLTDNLIGRIQKIIPGDYTIYLESPCEVKVQMTQDGKIIPIPLPLGMLADDILTELEVEACKYLYVKKANSSLLEMYKNVEKQIIASKTGIILPNTEEVRAVEKVMKETTSRTNGKVIDFNDYKNKK